VLIATNAIVLKRIPYGDTSVICRMFTEKMGKVSILAKGAWRPKNASGPLLEPINHIHIQFYNKNTRDLQILKDAGFIQQFPSLRNSLDRIILAFAIVEIIDKSSLESNPSPILYRLGWRILDKLNDGNQNQWIVFSFFLYQLSLRLGFMPNISNCGQCNNKMTQGRLDIFIGELICPDCASNCVGQIINLSSLEKLTSLHLDELNALTMAKKDVLDSIQFLDIFLSYHIEGLKKVHSMDMVRTIINEEKEAYNLSI
jgi:DNA repair protein RecO (recombination protein O)